MWRWTLRSLLDERLAFGLTAAAVGGALLLVLLFEAVFAGEAARIVAYPRRMDADVWVMQRGVSNMHMASSLIWDSKQVRVEDVAGVRRVTPILYLNSTVLAGGHRWFAYVIGIEAGVDRAGPRTLAAGRAPAARDEMVLPAVIARLAGIRLGDQARLSDRSFTVVGLSRGTFSMANSVVFVTLGALRDIMGAASSYSYLLVDLEPGRDPAAAAQRINAEVDGVHAMTAAEFVASDRGMALQMGVELIRLMTLIGATLAVVLTGFSAQAFVSRKTPELMICKALGARTAKLTLCVLVMALAMAAAGVLIAALAGLGLAHLSALALPQISLRLEPGMILHLAAIAGGSAVLAALAAATNLARIDPAAAFRT